MTLEGRLIIGAEVSWRCSVAPTLGLAMAYRSDGPISSTSSSITVACHHLECRMAVAAAASDDHTVTAAQRLGHMRSWVAPDRAAHEQRVTGLNHPIPSQ